jgi:hypothetical protein
MKCEPATTARPKKKKKKSAASSSSSSSSAVEHCGWTGELEHRQRHLDNDCEFVEVKCSHEGCSHALPRRDLDQHIKVCDCRKISCQHCGEGVIFVDMDEHVSACDSVPVPCLNGCNDIIFRGNLAQHPQVCSMAVIPCPFAGIGCDHGHITREALTAHMEEFQQRHMTMMGQTLQANEKKFHDLNKEITSLSSNNECLTQRVTNQQDTIATLSASNEYLTQHVINQHDELSQSSQKLADLKSGTAKVSWIIKDIMSKLNDSESLNEFSNKKTIIVPKVGACRVRLNITTQSQTDFLGLHVYGCNLPSKVCLEGTKVRILKKNDGTGLIDLCFSNTCFIEGSLTRGRKEFISKEALLATGIWNDGSLHIEADLVLSAIENNGEREAI